MSNAVNLEIVQNGMTVAGCGGPRNEALRDILHYAAVYGQDSPVEIKYRGRLYSPEAFFRRFVARSAGVEVMEVQCQTK